MLITHKISKTANLYAVITTYCSS